ncbi:MAG TPA: hypothetical protein ACFYD6_07190 [Candidatus Brocadiia bacterium]|nr:hypothetical protein [Candidatus Brocadiales bacterium]
MVTDKQDSRLYINDGLKGWKKYLPLINITLFVGVIILVVIGTVLFRAVPSPLTELERLKTKTPIQQVSVPAIQTNTALQEEYDLLANENPFAPGRKEWEISSLKPGYDAQKQDNKTPPKEPPKKIILHGIVIAENLKKALVKNPDPKPGVAPFLYVEEGNDVGGYRVKSIEPNQIRLVWEGQESVVNIFADKEHVKTLPSPGAAPYTPPPPPEGRSRPPHEMEMPSRRQPQAPEITEEEEEWDEEDEEEYWDEEEGYLEEEEEAYEEMDDRSRSYQPKRPFRRPRTR